MCISDEVGREVMGNYSVLEFRAGELFHNKLYCEYVECCDGMANRLSRSPIKNQKYCSRNPGRKMCGYYIVFEWEKFINSFLFDDTCLLER